MSESVKEQIVAKAAELFRQFGIRSVSIDDICKQLNISKKTFYLYFRQKEDLIQAVLDYIDDCISLLMTERFASKTATESVGIFVRQLREVKDMRNQPPLFYDLQKYYPDIKQQHDVKIIATVRSHIFNHLNKGIAEGIYRPDIDVEACASYITISHQSWVTDTLSPTYVSKERLVRFFVESTLRSIVTEKGMQLLCNDWNILIDNNKGINI